jgi:hypothetical protein
MTEPANFLHELDTPEFEPRLVTLYRDNTGRWRWQHVAGNHRIVSASSQGFTRKWSAKRNCRKTMGRDVRFRTEK